MTQKELGIKSGFSATTADVRIRQYESNKMVPKADKLKEIADALGVEPDTLKDHDIHGNADVLQVLFELEDNFGLVIEKDGDDYHLAFQEKNPIARFINYDLDAWYRKKEEISEKQTDDNYQVCKREYELWKSRFPLDQYKSENENELKLKNKYELLVSSMQKNFKISRVKEFILQFEKLIRNDFHIKIIHAEERSGMGNYVCCAAITHNELLDATGNAAESYAEYLAMLDCIEKGGIEIENSTTTIAGETYSCHYFYSSVLSTALNHAVREIAEEYDNGTLDDDLVQLQYQDSLQTFNVPIEDAR